MCGRGEGGGGGRQEGKRRDRGEKRGVREEKGGSNIQGTNVMFPACLFTTYMHE